MTINFSRPLNTPTELNNLATYPSSHASAQFPKPPKRSILDRLGRRKARTEESEDKSQPRCQNRKGSESRAVRVGAEKSATAIKQQQQRELAKAEATAHKDEKKTRNAEKKAREHIMGGVAWGFDPTAGMRLSYEGSEHSGCFVSGRLSDLVEDGEYEVDHLGRRTGRRWTNFGSWGIEQGGPGREGKFGHGSLKGKEPEILSSCITERP